jgi:peptidoglycan hydrolase-like protein with peptidoglycan-binding domain
MAIRAKRKPIEQKTDQREQVADRYPFRHSLDTGDKGALVLWAQSKLAQQGYYAGELDGRYDREVTLAVREFQSGKNLNITGVIDRRTWEAL